MENSLANLRDYNIPRDLLKAAGGNWNTVLRNLTDTAIAKETPKIFCKGGLLGSAITLGAIGILYSYCFMKDRKQKNKKRTNFIKQND